MESNNEDILRRNVEKKMTPLEIISSKEDRLLIWIRKSNKNEKIGADKSVQ